MGILIDRRFSFLQLGKGLLLDEKAQQLALQHWLEAVSAASPHLFFWRGYLLYYPVIKFNEQRVMNSCFLVFCRLIHDIDMDIICISTMLCGWKARAINLSSTGWFCSKKFLQNSQIFNGMGKPWECIVRHQKKTTNLISLCCTFAG